MCLGTGTYAGADSFAWAISYNHSWLGSVLDITLRTPPRDYAQSLFLILLSYMCLSQAVSRKGRKKALLIAVRYVRGIEIGLPRTHYDVQEFKDLLISSFFSSCVDPSF